MIRPPRLHGVAFTEKGDGDVRNDLGARERLGSASGVPDEWATAHQVHGRGVIHVDGSGDTGEADAIWTTVEGLAVAIFTADCFGVALIADEAVGVAHAGWRGARAGVIAALRDEMSGSGHEPRGAAIGPGIGPCCFEVGPEVAEQFDGYRSRTSWGTESVDLPAVIAAQLAGIEEVWTASGCTLHEDGWFSYRENETTRRMATIGWRT